VVIERLRARKGAALTGDGRSAHGAALTWTRNLSPDVGHAIEGARGHGRPLSPASRAPIEAALGADFAAVRVHTDQQADRFTRAVGAVAFTTGEDIFFRRGAYRPATSTGRELLAHELIHVLQQGGIQRRLAVGSADDPLEREADRLARMVVARTTTSAPAHAIGTQPSTGVPFKARLLRKPQIPPRIDQVQRDFRCDPDALPV
jgi:hypothetical protein